MSKDLDIIKYIEKQTGKVIMRLHHQDEEEFFHFTGFVTDPGDNVIHLNLSSFDLADITPLKALKNLQYLNLSSNKIVELDAIRELPGLTYLNLAFNQISNLAPLQELNALTYLNLESNRISQLKALEGLVSLIYLNLASNQIEDISSVKGLTELNYLNLEANLIENIYDLEILKELLELHLCNNKIQDILVLNNLSGLTNLCIAENRISDIYVLKYLKGLQKLDLSRNRISDITPLKDLAELTHLRLNNNRVSDTRVLGKLGNLKELELEHNRITEIAPLVHLKRLSQCNLAHNEITRIPTEIVESGMEITWKYIFSKGMTLNGNPLEAPPVEVVRQGRNAIKNYFKELEKGESIKYLKSKLILVGDEKVGKTSLKLKLQDPHYQIKPGTQPDSDSQQTEPAPWFVECQFKSDCREKVKIQPWDLGGQDIYQATHQFFLTKRSLYIFVWQARKEQETTSFGYWLNVVKQLSDNSPVIVVMNKADVYGKFIDQAAYQRKFDNIVAFHQVSCLTGKGIPELLEQIKETLAGMPHLEDRLPASWQQIRLRLEQENLNYIPVNRFFEICREAGLNKERAEFLSAYLHDMGIILHYRHDRALENVVFLNPEWATSAFYTLSETPAIRESAGRFTFNILSTIWDPVQYPVADHYRLIRLMEKFELCFNITGTHFFIIPDLLPTAATFQQHERYQSREESLHFQYHYDFIPERIFNRFICRNYYLINGENYCRFSVELVFNGTYALVSCDRLNERIDITVQGEKRVELLALIRRDMKHIHRTLNLHIKTHFDEKAPCNCRICNQSAAPHTFDYTMLKNFRKRGYQLFCPLSYEPVPTSRLLKAYKLIPQREEFIKLLLSAVSQLQKVTHQIKPDEISWNGFISRILALQNIMVKDHTPWGSFDSNKFSGRMDIKVEAEDRISAVCEEFLLQFFDQKKIENQLQQLFVYDPPDVKENVILIYSESEDFTILWKQYLNFIPQIHYKYKIENGVQQGNIPYPGIKLARTRHRKGNGLCNVYHLLVDMRPPENQ